MLRQRAILQSHKFLRSSERMNPGPSQAQPASATCRPPNLESHTPIRSLVEPHPPPVINQAPIRRPTWPGWPIPADLCDRGWLGWLAAWRGFI